MQSVHTSSPAETFYDLPMNNDVIQWSIFDYDANHVDNLPNYNLNSTTSHSSTPISIPCNPLHMPRNHVCQKEPTNNKHFQKLYHRKLSGKSLMVSWGFHMGMRRVCCETIPKHQWFFRRLSIRETMATPGKPVTLKPPVNIYPCGTWNHIFNTNFIDLLLYSGENCDQHGNIYFHRLAPTSLWI